MISDLQEHECYELLSSTTVGRIGFVRDGQVHILPMNYRTTDRGLLLRTSSNETAESSPANRRRTLLEEVRRRSPRSVVR